MDDVIVGVDRSATARSAATTAAELATAYHTNLHIVMCVKPLDTKPGADYFRPDSLAEAEQYLSDLAQSLPCQSVSTNVALGDPATNLCQEAKRLDARAIVVGNRRVQGRTRILGSVAGNVTKLAPCDVVVANTSLR